MAAKKFKLNRVFKIGRKKWYEMDPKVTWVAGLSPTKLKRRKEDRRASPWEGYAVIFFPQYNIGWKASVGFQGLSETLSQTPEAARIRFADNIGGNDHPDKKWKDFHKAGHRVRRVRIIDLGPA